MTVTPLQPLQMARGAIPMQALPEQDRFGSTNRGATNEGALATVTELSLDDLGVTSAADQTYVKTGAEALFISALLDAGEYVPSRWGVRDDQIHVQRAVHEFCARHQELAGCAPGKELIGKQFPRFPYTEGIKAKWAAAQVVDAHKSRVLRIASAKAAGHIANEEHDDALAVWKQGIEDARPTLSAGISALDITAIEAAEAVERCPLPAGALNSITGGLGPGEIILFAARTNVGKSWELVKCLVAAAEAGWTSYGFTMEMPAYSYNERLHQVMLRNLWKRPWADLNNAVRAELLEEWAEGCSGGSITVHDPSTLPRYDVNALAACEGEKVFVAVDHIGLARTTSGLRAVTDWRAAAEISNEHKEVALERKIAVAAAVQVNREGERSGMPGTTHLSQTDALGQDCDFLVTMRKYGEDARKYHLPKARRVVCGQTWYTRFRPSDGVFDDITREQADALKAASEERNEMFA